MRPNNGTSGVAYCDGPDLPQPEPMVIALSRDIVQVVVEVMNDGATDVTKNERNHRDENHLNCRRHCPYDVIGKMLMRNYRELLPFGSPHA